MNILRQSMNAGLIRRFHLSSSELKNSTAASILSSKLEVERKFTSTDSFSQAFKTNEAYNHQSPQQTKASGLTIHRHPDQVIVDRYFDHKHILAHKGLWARRRMEMTLDWPPHDRQFDTNWEVKQSVGGDYINSAMVEHDGRQTVFDLWRDHFSRELQITHDISAELNTYRKVWTVKDDVEPGTNDAGDYHIVLDHVTLRSNCWKDTGPGSFSHTIGEVEMIREVAGGCSTEEHDLIKQSAIDEVNDAISAFMQRQPLLFKTHPRPVGKLTAFFAWKAAMTGASGDS